LKSDNIALFDLDGTLCDYDQALLKSLEGLRSPNEDVITVLSRKNHPTYLRARMDLIRSKASWWTGLKTFKLGMDIWTVAGNIGFQRMVLTQGPKRNPKSWMGKKMWVDTHLGEDVDITITRNKSQVYGNILVDDYQDYIEGWLKWRPRGLVIMPAHDYNKRLKHPQVIRYTGMNLPEVTMAMIEKFIK